MLSRITSNIPASSVQSQQSWTHLVALPLTDPDYGTPKAVDLLLGAAIFSHMVLHGQRFGRSRSPLAFKTQLGGFYVTGTTGFTHRSHESAGSCYLAMTVEDL